MKKINSYLIIVICIALSACKKTETKSLLVSVNVINATLDVAAIKVNPSGKAVSWNAITDLVNYGANKFYYAPMGAATFKTVASADTTRLLLNGSYNLMGKLYTLYLTGTSVNVESMLVEEKNFPYIPLDKVKLPSADSVVNVRFVNLSANSPALNVNIKNSTSNEVANLAYKSIGDWKAYVNKATTTTNYIFEVRNAGTNELLSTYTFGATTTNRFRSVALVIRGSYGVTTGTNAFGISAFNYF